MNQMINCSYILSNHQFNVENVLSNSFDNDTFLTNNYSNQCNQLLDGLVLNSSEANYYLNISDNFNYGATESPYKWIYLVVILFVIFGGSGNILVCLSVALDKNLQNVTNYFLFSLAVADLLVCLFVMPLSAIPAFLGKLYHILNKILMTKSFSLLFRLLAIRRYMV